MQGLRRRLAGVLVATAIAIAIWPPAVSDATAIGTPRSNLYKKLEQYAISQEKDG